MIVEKVYFHQALIKSSSGPLVSLNNTTNVKNIHLHKSFQRISDYRKLKGPH